MSAPPNPIARNDVFSLFPTPVWNLRLDAASRDAIGVVIDDLAAARAADNRPVERGGRVEIEAGLQAHLEPLLRLFIEQARAVLAHQRVEHDALEVVSCAVAVDGAGAGGEFRTQTNACLAGVYFASGAPAACALEFEDPRSQAHIITAPRRSPGAPGAFRARVDAAPGHLLVFPAWLRHAPARNAGDSVRVTVSMSIMFGDFAETMSRPKWRGNVVLGTS